MVRLENVYKYFNKRRKNEIRAICDTSLELDKGLVALLGPSGCGKTTLLNAIGGLDKVDSGKIYINGKKITKVMSSKVDKIRNLNIGYIFQDYKLIDNMSVFDNVAIVLKMIGIKDKKEIKKRVDYILDKVGMYRYKLRPCSMLSGGERQRVGIARAIVKNPSIILADEPTGNLDSKNTIEIMNIIKSISRDKLVILVTHEADIAKFYATRIIEVSDGKIVRDYENSDNDELDYRMDNKIYLKDYKYHNVCKNDNFDINMYSDKSVKLKLNIVFKNGNIYIENKNQDNIEVIDSNSNIELINDKYKKMDKSIYEKYSFNFDNLINKDIKLKYSSIFNIFTIISNGFKKVFNYSFIKKILLLGFFMSGIFVTYSISNILGVTDIKDSDFIRTNLNYVMINSNKIKIDDYLGYANDDRVNYILPGDSEVVFNVKTDYYYQTMNSYSMISGSLSGLSMLNEDDIILGRMPVDDREIVIDKSVFNKNGQYVMAGITGYEKLLNQIVYLIVDRLEYKIVGIVDKNSPSIYAKESEFINIISNSNDNNNQIYGNITIDIDSKDEKQVYNYNLYKDDIVLKEGKLPDNDYEVIVNIDKKDVMKLNKEIDVKVNDKKLKVVGYYDTKYNFDYYFVNESTIMYDVISYKNSMTVYPKNKEEFVSGLKEENINVKDVYKVDKDRYIDEKKESIKSSVIVSLVMLSISLIEIILMTRSSFLSRIKGVGIYRAIGVKKSDIYKMFIGESFAITSISSLPGVLFISYCLYELKDISYISSNYMINIWVVLISVIVIYLFNIIVSLLPVFYTMRKTPANILSRHDLD